MKNKNLIGVVVQCRLSSTRLKNKILHKIQNKTLLEILIERLKKINANKIVLLIAKEKNYEKIVKIAKKMDVNFYIGSKNNVLLRTINGAKKFRLKNLIRITSDCPLIDPYLVNKGINIYNKKKLDHLCNNHPPSWPHGLDFEIFSLKKLEKTYKGFTSNSEKENVTEKLRKEKNLKKYNLKCHLKLDRYYRWTLDTRNDYLFLSELFKKLPIINMHFRNSIILNYLKKNPNIQNINASTHHFYFR